MALAPETEGWPGDGGRRGEAPIKAAKAQPRWSLGLGTQACEKAEPRSS